MKYKVVTCFGPGGWEKYAKKFYEGVREHWALGEDLSLDVYHHGCMQPEGCVDAPYVAVRFLEQFAPWQEFHKRWGSFDAKGDWRLDVARFGNKVFAIQQACQEAEADFVVWLDADVVMKKGFSHKELAEIVDSDEVDFYGLFRAGTFIESSAMAFKVRGEDALGQPLAVAVGQSFISGQFQAFREWHDGYVYSWMVDHFKINHGLIIANWTPPDVQGPGSDAFNRSPWGVFMEHLKGDKKESLENILRRELAKHYDVNRLIFQGEKDEQLLLKFVETVEPMDIDGAVIHGVNDQAALEKFLAQITEAKWSKIIMGLSDEKKVGLLLKPGVKVPNQGRAEVKIVPRDCVDKDVTFANIDKNRELIRGYLGAYHPHMEECLIVSAGPSLDRYLDEIRERQAKGAKVVCVKHSLPTLLKAGIVPWACVVLDPRNPKEKSTHGIVRETLFDNIPKETRFFVATITNPDVTELLLSKGAHVIGWHPWSDAAKDYPWPEGTRLITGGTCAALRAISLMHSLGWRAFHLYGFDFAYEGLTEEQMKEQVDGKPKYHRVSTKGAPERTYMTTGELMAAAQDIEKLALSRDMDFALFMHGDSLGQQMFLESGYRPRDHYSLAL